MATIVAENSDSDSINLAYLIDIGIKEFLPSECAGSITIIKDDVVWFKLSLALLAGMSMTPLINAFMYLALGALLSLLFAWFVRKKRCWGVAMFFSFGLCFSAAATVLRSGDSLPESFSARSLPIQGVVVSLPVKSGRKTRFDFLMTHVEGQGLEAPLRLRLTAYQFDLNLSPRQTWYFQAKLKPRYGFLNIAGSDYEALLFRQGVVATGWVKEAQQLLEVEPRLGLGWGDWFSVTLQAWRYTILTDLRGVLIGFEHSAVLEALTLGVRDGLNSEQRGLLRRMGLSHLLAISGLHVGLLAGSVASVLGLVWGVFSAWRNRYHSRRWMAWGAMGAAVGYAALAGFSLPTVRAMVGICVLSVSFLINRPIKRWDGFAVSLIVILLLDPFAPLRMGFWLSFLCVWQLIWLWPRVSRWSVWSQLVSMQFVLSGFSLVAGWYWMGEGSLVSPWVNLFAIPLVGWGVIPFALLGCLFLTHAPEISEYLFWIADFSLQVLFTVLRFIDQNVALSSVSNVGSLSLLFGVMGFILLLGLVVSNAQKTVLFVILSLCLYRAAMVPQRRHYLQVDVMDVGQGLAVLVQTQNHSLLYDMGPRYRTGFDTGKIVVEPVLQYYRQTELDVAIISHTDMDHVGGWRYIREVAKIERVFSSGVLLGESDRLVESCLPAKTWDWDGIRFYLTQATDVGSANNRSCVLLIKPLDGLASSGVLLAGDIEMESEAILMRQAIDWRSGLLLAPHHGSKSSSSDSFIDKVNPEKVVFSRGYRNRYRIPALQVVRRYQQRQVAIYDTALQGGLTFWLDDAHSVWRSAFAREIRKADWRYRPIAEYPALESLQMQ